MKNAILAIATLAVLGCHAQYKTMLHARITTTNSVVVDIPDWAKSDTPPGGGGGGGGGGTTNYNDLTNKPSVNGTELVGDVSIPMMTTNDVCNIVTNETLSGWEFSTDYPDINVSELELKWSPYGEQDPGWVLFYRGTHISGAPKGAADDVVFSVQNDWMYGPSYKCTATRSLRNSLGLARLSDIAGFATTNYISKNIADLATTNSVSIKRDKTDNIVATNEIYQTPWKITCDDHILQAELNNTPPTIEYNSNFGAWVIVDYPDIPGYGHTSGEFVYADESATTLRFDLTFFRSDTPYAPIPIIMTREKLFLAKKGESYVSPIYVTNTIEKATADHVKSNDMASAIAPINNNVNTMWGYIYGENVWIAVTNYMRSVGGVAPSLQLWEKRDGQTNLVYWSAEEIDIRVGDKIDIAMSNIVDTVVTAKADRAWSKYQSMTGADNPQPNDVTIVSTPSIMLSGGYEWQRFVDTGAEVWVLKCNDLITLGADTNAYFRITDLEGETQFAIEKTASKLVDAVPTATGFTTDGNNYFKVTFSGNIQPTIYVSLDLVNSPFIECSATENDYGLICSWEHDSAANTYTATIAYNAGDGKPSKMFVYGKVLQEGSTVVRHTAPSSFDGGIIIDGVQYSVGTATIDGKTVLTLNPVTRAVSE